MPDARVQIDGTMVLAGAAVLGIGFVWLSRKKLLEKVDPTSRENVAYQGAQHLYRGVTGSDGTIGGDLYDLIHSSGEADTWGFEHDSGDATTTSPGAADDYRDHVPMVLF